MNFVNFTSTGRTKSFSLLEQMMDTIPIQTIKIMLQRYYSETSIMKLIVAYVSVFTTVKTCHNLFTGVYFCIRQMAPNRSRTPLCLEVNNSHLCGFLSKLHSHALKRQSAIRFIILLNVSFYFEIHSAVYFSHIPSRSLKRTTPPETTALCVELAEPPEVCSFTILSLVCLQYGLSW